MALFDHVDDYCWGFLTNGICTFARTHTHTHGESFTQTPISLSWAYMCSMSYISAFQTDRTECVHWLEVDVWLLRVCVCVLRCVCDLLLAVTDGALHCAMVQLWMACCGGLFRPLYSIECFGMVFDREWVNDGSQVQTFCPEHIQLNLPPRVDHNQTEWIPR